jgi:hypothetical protein
LRQKKYAIYKKGKHLGNEKGQDEIDAIKKYGFSLNNIFTIFTL